VAVRRAVQPGDRASWAPAFSADGRYVAFVSEANNLVPGDTANADVFVRDRQTGQTTRVSVASDGAESNSSVGSVYASKPAAISADGRYIAFPSWASNLVPGDTNRLPDVFVRDRQTGTTERVSVASDRTQTDSPSELPAISADGRYVAFASEARTLVPGDANSALDVFLRDRSAGQTMRVSVALDGGTATGRQSGPPCPPMAASWRSRRGRATSWPATRTASPTSSCHGGRGPTVLQPPARRGVGVVVPPTR
jgi:Tol biopolymer transport system component